MPDIRSEKLSVGRAERCESGGGTSLVSYGVPHSPMIRVVDPHISIECPAGTFGEVWVHGDWVHGDNVAMGYWRKPQETDRCSAESFSLYRLAHPKALG
jgi:long-chain fatty acid adenylyltransferase FadD28